VAEAEKLAEAELAAEMAEPPVSEEGETVTGEIPAEIPTALEPTPVSAEASESEATEPLPAQEEILPPAPVLFEPPKAAKPQLRFAEDIMLPKTVKPPTKTKKKKKKGGYGKETAEDGIKLKKTRRGADIMAETEEDESYEQD